MVEQKNGFLVGSIMIDIFNVFEVYGIEEGALDEGIGYRGVVWGYQKCALYHDEKRNGLKGLFISARGCFLGCEDLQRQCLIVDLRKV